MQWGGGQMMYRGPNYPGGMMHSRMRGMYPQSRPPMDPRHQMEMERRHRMMMHGARPGMHAMQRPPYMEVGVGLHFPHSL